MSTSVRTALAALLVLTACGDKRPEATPAGGPDQSAEAGGPAGPTAGTAATPAAASPVKPPVPDAPLPADVGEHTGGHRFSRRIGGPMADAGRAVAVDGKGTIAVAGYLRGRVDLGAGQVLTADDADGFVAVHGQDGTLRWARNFGGKGEDAAEAVAIDGAGNVIVGGAFSYEVVMADGKLDSKGADDMFVVKLGPDGRRLWGKRFGGVDVDAVYGLAADSAGNIYVTGEVGQTIYVGETKLVGLGAADMLVMKLSPDGAPLWARRFGALGPDYGRVVRVTTDGGVIALGEVSREVDFGGGPVESKGNRDAVVVSLGPDGSYRWATRFGGTNDELALGLTVDPVGSVVVTGSFDDKIEFAGQTFRAVGLADAYVAKLGADGSQRWMRTFGSKEADIGGAVANDAQGNLYAVGWFWYEIDFGKGALASAGRKDAYVTALAPDGKTLWARRFGGAGNEFLQSVASLTGGGLVAVGTFHGKVAFGGPELTAESAPDAQLPLGDVAVVALER
jgi:hypothetical protein